MSAPDRAHYGALQAQLLDALLRGDGYPEGFVAAQADAAGHALRRKRARAVESEWPALALALGDRFDARFDAFARTTAAPAFGHALSDGLAFAQSLERMRLTDDARVELLLARALVQRDRAGAWRRRRGVFAGAARLRTPRHRVLLVVRLPGLGPARVSVALGRRPC